MLLLTGLFSLLNSERTGKKTALRAGLVAKSFLISVN